MEIHIKMSNGLDMRLIQLKRPNDIPDIMGQIEAALYQMFEGHVEQVLYQREYKIQDEDIVADFNGDALLIAMGIRMQDEDEMFAACGLSPDLYTYMQEGRLKPSTKHLEGIAKWLDFPMDFFTSDIKYHEPKFVCYRRDYADYVSR